MTTKQPWDRPPKLEYGDPSDELIYLAVGRALSNWESVENEFIELFAVFIGCKSIHRSWLDFFPALRAYGSQISFASRIDMVDAAGSAYFFLLKDEEKKKAKEAEDEFPKLLAKCRNFAALRNDIAHGMVQISIVRDDEENTETYKGNYLFPSLFASRKYRLGEPALFAYTAAQIEQIAEHFQSLSYEISTFHGLVALGPRPWPSPNKLPEQPPRRE